MAIGTQVYTRRPNAPDAAWLITDRAAPSASTAFGPLALRDGTSLGDPRLYRGVVDAGVATLAQGEARKIVADLDMNAVAVAMGLSGDDAARLGRMTGRVTVWITSDGRIARHVLALDVPSASGTVTLETTLDLSDIDAPLAVTLP